MDTVNNKRSENILIIGGTGKIGMEILKQFSSKNIIVKALVRSSQKADEVIKLGLEPVFGDLKNPSSIFTALKGIEKVFLLTTPSVNEAELKNNVINAAKKAGVRYLVLLSGAGASYDSLISQAKQHAIAEDHLKASGLGFTILQPYFVMQNFLSQLESIKSQGAIFGNYNSGKIAMVDARDIAAVAFACLTENGHDGKTYVITGGEAITFSQVAEQFSLSFNKKINYINIPSEGLIKALIGFGFPEWLAGDLALLGNEIAADQFINTTKIVEKVAKQPPFTIVQFVLDFC